MRALIGGFQLIAGLYGFLVLFSSGVGIADMTGINLLLLSSLSMAAGGALIVLPRLGFWLSLLAQAAQCLHFRMGAFVLGGGLLASFNVGLITYDSVSALRVMAAFPTDPVHMPFVSNLSFSLLVSFAMPNEAPQTLLNSSVFAVNGVAGFLLLTLLLKSPESPWRRRSSPDYESESKLAEVWTSFVRWTHRAERHTSGSFAEVPESKRFRVGFWLRGMAFGIDLLVILPVTVAAILIRYGFGAISNLGQPQDLGILAGVFVIYHAAFNYFIGFTPGKWLFSYRIVDARTGGKPRLWQSVLRPIAAMLSAAPALLGFIWSAWARDGRAWHDYLARTIAVTDASYQPFKRDQKVGLADQS